MDRIHSVYGRMGLAASHVDIAMDFIGQSNGVSTSVNLVLAYSHVSITLFGSPSPNLVMLLNIVKLCEGYSILCQLQENLSSFC